MILGPLQSVVVDNSCLDRASKAERMGGRPYIARPNVDRCQLLQTASP